MVLRYFHGDSGGEFRLRASKSGVDALSGNTRDMSIHEGLQPMVPWLTGEVSIAARSSQSAAFTTVTVNLGRSYARPPMLVLKNNLNLLPGGVCKAKLQLSTGTLTISNMLTEPLTVKYAIFEEI
jgi:hypothetical protein